MADTNRNAVTTHAGDGSEDTFAIGFPVLDESHIVVKVEGVEQTITTDYTVNLADLTITFTAGSIPPAGSAGVIEFTRQTPHSGLFVGGLIGGGFSSGAGVSAQDLNRALLQGLYYTEEVQDEARINTGN